MKNLIYIALAMCSTYLSAQNSITTCSSTFTDIGGQSSQYINNESTDWLICPDDITNYLSLEFTYVDIETAIGDGVNGSGCKDVLYIYDGLDDTAPLVGNFCGQESTDGKMPSLNSSRLNVGMSFTPNNSTGCFFIKFESDATNNRNGWNAVVECCEPSLPSHMSDGVNCPEAINNGVVFDFDVDLSCVRQGEITNFTDYKYNEFTPEGMEEAENMPYKAYFKIEANSNGGFTSVDMDPIDDLGDVSFYVLGPLSGTCPMYTGGFIVDFKTASDPSSLIFNMSPNSSYMIVVASNIQGAFRLFNNASSSSLPVEIVDYSVTKKSKNVSIEWTTTQEVNNLGFELYRSYNNVDFEQIAEVESKGNYSTTTDYSYLDTDLKALGSVYYYLRQIDLDGTSTDYDVRSVDFSSIKSISAYPNPAADRIYIESQNQEDALIKIYDAMGRIIIQEQSSFPMNVDVSEIPTGVYTLIVESDTEVKAFRQVIN